MFLTARASLPWMKSPQKLKVDGKMVTWTTVGRQSTRKVTRNTRPLRLWTFRLRALGKTTMTKLTSKEICRMPQMKRTMKLGAPSHQEVRTLPFVPVACCTDGDH